MDFKKEGHSLKVMPRPVKTYHDRTYDRIAPSKIDVSLGGKTLFITGGGKTLKAAKRVALISGQEPESGLRRAKHSLKLGSPVS